jgi:hypothetical protein
MILSVIELTVGERFDDLLADLPHDGVKIIQGLGVFSLKELFLSVSVKRQ